jgi:hypothetical protein
MEALDNVGQTLARRVLLTLGAKFGADTLRTPRADSSSPPFRGEESARGGVPRREEFRAGSARGRNISMRPSSIGNGP